MSAKEINKEEKVIVGEAHTLILTVPIDLIRFFIDTPKQ
jgi:hypothetical protein